MRRILSIILALLMLSGPAYGFKSFSYLFVGRWQPAEDPLLIDEPGGFQDIQNMRKDGKRLRGVAGHTNTTNGVVDATYKFIKNGFHFTKDQPAENHVIVYAEDSGNTGARIWQNTTAIPNVGDFSATALSTPASGYGISRFSYGPQGTVVHANGVASEVWGGDEFRAGAFITSTAAVTASTVTGAKDQTEAIRNTSSASGDTVTIAQASDLVFLIGSTRPLQGAKLYVSTANTGSPTLTGKYWNGSSWAALSSFVDNTSGLKTTGTLTWDSTVSTAKLKYLEGYILFWYQFQLSSGTAALNYVTVDAPWQAIQNIWDLTETVPASIQVYAGTNYIDYTDEGIVEATDSLIILDSLGTNQSLLVGFAEPQQGVKIRMLATKENGNTATMTVKYWTGSAWAAVSDQVDGTSAGSISLYQTGVVTWSAVARGSEFKVALTKETPLYYYQFTFDAALDAEVEAYYISGIPVPDPIPAFKFPALFQERVFLFNETGGPRNRAIYSVSSTPDIFNGPESGELYFGDEKEVVATGVLYNLFSTSGIHQLIVFKKHETYRLTGTGPEDWEIKLISGTIGAVAPLSIANAETKSAEGDTVHVLIWQTDAGVAMTAGGGIQMISEDIKNYWDPHSSDAIATARIDDSVGWYDAKLNAYKLLISSGSGQTTHNIELEYNLTSGEWTKLYRENATGANPLQAGFQVVDTDGQTYSYGATNEGYVYRLENGTTWAGTPIAEYVQTKDLLLDNEQPLMRSTTVRYLRFSYEDKNNATALSYLTLSGAGDYLLTENSDKIITSNGEQIAVTHYCNQVATGASSAYQHIPSAVPISSGPFNTQDVALGPCISHSFKFAANITNVTDGMELTGLGIYYDFDNTISVD